MPDNILKQIQTALSVAWQVDIEGGNDWYNREMRTEFARRYPQLNQVINNIMEMKDGN